MEEEKNDKKEKSWFERNAWMIAVGFAVFLMKFCADIQPK